MSTALHSAPDGQLVNDIYMNRDYTLRSDSLATRSVGGIAGEAGVSILEWQSHQFAYYDAINQSTLLSYASVKPSSASMAPQGHQRTRSTDTSVPTPVRTATKDTTETRLEKSNKSNSSVVPIALKNVGRKLKPNNTFGFQFNPGLINLGNSCYLNSTMQGLMSTRLLENMVTFTIPSDFAGRLFPERSPALRNGRGEYALPYVSGMEVTMTFIRSLEHGWRLRETTTPKQRVPMSLRELRNRLGVKYDQYLDFQQQDAHEFLRHLLDCMYMEEFDVIKKYQPPAQKRRHGEPVANSQPQPIPDNERFIPFVDQVFGGQLASMLICSSCKKVSHTYEPFMDLSLSIRSEEDKESRRNRLKQFAQRFTKQSGRPVPRPLSNPPSPRKSPAELDPQVINIDPRRRSAELLSNRSDSDPDDSKPQSANQSNTLSPPDSESIPDSVGRLGRRLSAQLKLRRSGERSRSQEARKDKKDESQKKAKNEAAYLRRIMADTVPSKNPLELLRNGLGTNHSANSESIASAAASWLRLGPTHGPSLLHCLRQFTNVESLEGDNMVGCSRCWKLANPGYMGRRKRADSSSSSSSDDSSDDEDDEASSTGKNGEMDKVQLPLSMDNSGSLGVPSASDTPDSLSINTRTSDTSYGDGSYQGRTIPSISTTSPPPTDSQRSILLNGKSKSTQNSLHTATTSNVTSSVYLTPASSRHGSIRRTGSSNIGDIADDSASTASASDMSASVNAGRQKEVRMAVPPLPKSQRVILRRAYKRYLIAVPPPVLVIHLKRFQQVSRTPISLFASLKKIEDFISFPEYLDLKPFIAPRKEEFGLRPSKIKDTKGAYDDQVIYRLYAVVVHIGNMLGGHYIAYTALRDPPAESPNSETASKGAPPERRWAFHSDQVVRFATLEEVLAAKAYLCFYERITEPPVTHGPSTSGTSNVQQRKK